MGGKFKENSRTITKFLKEKLVKRRKILCKFSIKFGESLYKIYGISTLISITFESKNLRIIIKSIPSRNNRDQNIEIIVRKIW